MWMKYNDNYEVSSEGEVRSIRRNIILKTDFSNKGYSRVSLGKERHTVHRLVALLFIPNTNNLPQVNHINHNKLDNRAVNLEWCTNQYNNKHGYLHGRISGRTILSIDALNHIIQALTNKELSVKELASIYNVKPITIYKIKEGKHCKRLTM